MALALAAAVSLTLAVLAGLRVLPEGTPSATVSADVDRGSALGGAWLIRSEEHWFACTSRATALVAPSSIGVGGRHLHLEFGVHPPRNDAPAPTNDFPITMGPGSTLDDLDPKFFQDLRAGVLPSGTLAVWPFERRVGWPLPCLRYWILDTGGWNRSGFWWTKGPPFTIARGWSVGSTSAGPLDPRVIPLEPIWSGLLLNTLVFGAAFLAFGTGLSMLRARGRRRANRCVSCGYPLGELACCPECGTATRTERC